MIITATAIPQVYVIEPERIQDSRGFFARTWCKREFEELGLNSALKQCNTSFNKKVGTLRGLHYQAPPHAECKLVRCTMGSILDVALDLRPDSPAFRRHVGVTLSAENRMMLYIPEGVAHGFQTLEDDTEVFYQMTEFYHPESARGVRWNDPAFGIVWPDAIRTLSDRDRDWPDFNG